MGKATSIRTQRQKMEAKEQAILNAARAEFSAMGVEGAKMSAIAKRASVAEGTVYLYYRNKKELLDAVVSKFWQDLTRGAKAATRKNTDTIQRLEALARFHLRELVNEFDFVGFTVRTRETGTLDSPSLEPIRGYVALFDEIFSQGVDRGIFVNAPEIWIARDLFYGTLEYASRTLHLHPDRAQEDVVEHLVSLFKIRYGQTAAPETSPLTEVNERLERIESMLKNQ